MAGDIVKELLSNPVMQLMAYLLAILGIVLSCYFYFKGKKEKIPRYFIVSQYLIKNFLSKYDALQIKYNNEDISNLTLTNIIFWNNGKEVINRNDIASSDPLVIKIKEGNIFLDAKVIYENNCANQFSIEVSEDKKEIFINFDYLGFEDGAVMQLFHNAISNGDIYIEGTIKGVPPLMKKKNRKGIIWEILRNIDINIDIDIFKDVHNSLANKKLAGYLAIFFGVFIWIFMLIMMFSDEIKGQMNGELERMLFDTKVTWLTVLFVAGASSLYFISGYKYLKSNVPKKFERFEEDFKL